MPIEMTKSKVRWWWWTTLRVQNVRSNAHLKNLYITLDNLEVDKKKRTHTNIYIVQRRWRRPRCALVVVLCRFSFVGPTVAARLFPLLCPTHTHTPPKYRS